MILKLKNFITNYLPARAKKRKNRHITWSLSDRVKGMKYLGYNYSRMRTASKKGISGNKYTKRKVRGFKIWKVIKTP